MSDEHNELNDIILNRTDRGDARKKMLIGIGALAIVLIVIVIIMGSISQTPTQLPAPALPAQKAASSEAIPSYTDSVADAQLDAVAEKVKEQERDTEAATVQSDPDIVIIDDTSPTVVSEPAKQPKPAVEEPKPEPAPKPAAATAAHTGEIYIQVGSFSRYKPDPKFLDKIESSGYTYRFHRIVMSGKINNKVLVGPFKDRSDARANLEDVRKKIEPGAFIYTIKE